MALEKIKIQGEMLPPESLIETLPQDFSTLVKDILENVGDGDPGTILLGVAATLIVSGFGVFGVYFIKLVQDKGFLRAVDYLESTYPKNPEVNSLLGQVRKKLGSIENQ